MIILDEKKRKFSPILLHYYITQRCNCRCVFCDIWKQSKVSDARLNQVKSNLSRAKACGVKFVDFTGGEPLCHAELPDMLHYAKKLKLYTSVTTNCLSYPERAKEISGLVNFLHFSLDALNPSLHNHIRGHNAFDAVMNSIDIALSLGEKPDVLFTVTEDTIDQLFLLAEFAKKLRLMLIVNPVFSHTSQHPLSGEMLDRIERYSSHPFVYVNKAFNKLRWQGGNSISAPRCRVVDSTIIISPDNKLILPCYHFAREHLTITSLDTLFKDEKWQYYRHHQGRFDFCQGCHLNCYFDPSFNYRLDGFFLASLAAKTKYMWDKHILRRFYSGSSSIQAQNIANSILSTYHN